MKNKMLPRFLLLAAAFAFAWSCITPQEFPPEPFLKNAQVSDTLIEAGVDSLVISFEFQDGDGDLGNKKNDTLFNIFLIDNRTGFEYPYQMPVLGNRDQAITGTVWVTIDPFNINCRPFNDGRDTLRYQIYVVDRAENKSNIIFTPEVILICR